MELPNEEATRRFNRASELYREERYPEALQILDQLQVHRKNSRRVMFARAECLYRMGHMDDALRLCDELIAYHDYDPAQKLRAKIEDRQIASLHEQQQPNPAAMPAAAMPVAHMDFDIPLKHAGPPPPLPEYGGGEGGGGAFGDSDNPAMLFVQIAGSLLLILFVSAGLAAFFVHNIEDELISLPLALLFVFSQLIAYAIALFIILLIFGKFPKVTLLENLAAISVICAMLSLAYALSGLSYLILPEFGAEILGLFLLFTILEITLKLSLLEAIIFLIISGVIRFALAIMLIGAQLTKLMA